MEFIHVRLRPGRDDDIKAWYDVQDDKSEAIREAIRAYVRLHNGDTQEAVVRQAVSRELARLPDVVAVAVRDALAGYSLTPPVSVNDSDEDPIQAAIIDEQLANFFEDG